MSALPLKADSELARINSKKLQLGYDFLVISDIPHVRRVGAAFAAKVPVYAAAEQWAVVRLMWKELLRARDVSRRDYSVLSTLCGSSQVERNLRIPKAILAMNDVGASAELAVCCAFTPAWLRHEIGHGDPKDDLRPAVVGHFGHLRKIPASLAAQFSARGALVGR